MVEGRNHHYSTRRIEMVRMVVVSSFYHHSTRRIETVRDRKSTRLNSSHDQISYAVFCLKKKKKHNYATSAKQIRRLISSHTKKYGADFSSYKDSDLALTSTHATTQTTMHPQPLSPSSLQ